MKEKNGTHPCWATPHRHAQAGERDALQCPQLGFPPNLHSFCHFSAKFDLYTFYYICFFCYPNTAQACSALPYPALPCSACLHPFAVISGNRPWLFFSVTVVPCGANEFKCVRNWVIKISLNCASLPSVPTRFLKGVQAKISLWIWQHFYIFVYFNLWPSAVQFISRAKCKWGENEAW